MENEKVSMFDPPYGDIIKDTCDDMDKLYFYSKQQDRTLKLKRELLQARRKYPLESVTGLCQIVGIESRKTFYNWYNDDIYFRAAYEGISEVWYDSAMDLLKVLMFHKHNGIAIRYFLSKFDPPYMTQRTLRTHVMAYVREEQEEAKKKKLAELMGSV